MRRSEFEVDIAFTGLRPYLVDGPHRSEEYRKRVTKPLWAPPLAYQSPLTAEIVVMMSSKFAEGFGMRALNGVAYPTIECLGLRSETRRVALIVLLLPASGSSDRPLFYKFETKNVSDLCFLEFHRRHEVPKSMIQSSRGSCVWFGNDVFTSLGLLMSVLHRPRAGNQPKKAEDAFIEINLLSVGQESLLFSSQTAVTVNQ